MRISSAVVAAPALASPSLKQQIKAATDIIHVAASARRLFGVNHLLLGIFSLRQLFRSGGTWAGASVGKPDSGELPIDGFTIDQSLSHRALTWAATFIAKRAPRARIVELRRRNFAELTRLLSGFKAFRPLHAKLPAGAVPYVLPLWVVQPDPGYAVLRKMGFPVSRWDRVWPRVVVRQADAGISWSHHVLQLACHQDLDNADLQTMAKILVDVYAKDETPVTNQGTLLAFAESPSRLPGRLGEFTDGAA